MIQKMRWILRLACGLALAFVTASGARAQDFRQFPTPTAAETPSPMVTAPDGGVWFVETFTAQSLGLQQKLARISPTGQFREFPVPVSTHPIHPNISDLAAAADGSIWFTEHEKNSIGRLSPAGVITEFAAAGAPNAITIGGDGNVWFAEEMPSTSSNQYELNYKIGRVTSAGVVSEFDVPTTNPGVLDLTGGPDGNVWFVEYASDKIGRITPSGAITEFAAIGNGNGWMMVRPTRIIGGSDGNVWYLDSFSDVARITPAGDITFFHIPGQSYGNSVNQLEMARTADGAIWFSAQNPNVLYRVAADGTITSTPAPLNLVGVTGGADGNLWLSGVNTIARLDLSGPGQELASVYSSVQANSQSFLRFYNSSAAAATARVTLADGVSGATLATWTTPPIPANAELQFPITTIENQADRSFTKPPFYAVSIQSAFPGSFQHVLWRVTDGTLTNLSTCFEAVAADPAVLTGVHSTLLDGGYPSVVVINNGRPADANVTLGIYDARDSTRLGTYQSSIPANGQAFVTSAEMEAAGHFQPSSGMYHYVIKAEGGFWGTLQHVVINKQDGVLTDMTAACTLRGDQTPPSNITTFVSGGAAGSLRDIAPGNDGNVWFTRNDVKGIGRINPAGVITTLSTPDDPGYVTTAPDGSIWYTAATNIIARIAPDGTVSRFTVTVGTNTQTYPYRLAAGPDGNIWFTLSGRIGRVTPAGVVTTFALPYSQNGDQPGAIVRGPDGAMWFTFGQQIGRITMAGDAAAFNIQQRSVRGIVVGGDGNLWFAGDGFDQGMVGRITPAGAATIYPQPRTMIDIAAGADGNLWVDDGAAFFRLKLDGSVAAIGRHNQIDRLAMGADGNLWFIDSNSGGANIGRVAVPPTDARVAAVFSSAVAADGHSFLRVHNTGPKPGPVAIGLWNIAGSRLGTWSSPPIAPNAELQFAVTDIERALGVAANGYYLASVEGAMEGTLQHVLWRTTDGTLTNLSTCRANLLADGRELSGVHSSLLQSGFPSTVVIRNTGSVAATVRLGIYDARDGTKLGSYASASVAAGGQVLTTMAAMETAAGVSPSAGMYHYVIKAETPFSGFLQHLVDNKASGTTVDMTTVCALQ